MLIPLLPILGSFITSISRPSKKIRYGFENIKTGLVFGVVARDLVPHILKHKGLKHKIYAAIGLILGVIMASITMIYTPDDDGYNTSQFGYLISEGEATKSLSKKDIIYNAFSVFISGILVGIAVVQEELTAGQTIGILLDSGAELMSAGMRLGDEMKIRNWTIKNKSIATGALSTYALTAFGLGSVVGRYMNSMTDGIITFAMSIYVWLTYRSTVQITNVENSPFTPEMDSTQFYLGFLAIIFSKWS
jgi:hypothetical protein